MSARQISLLLIQMGKRDPTNRCVNHSETLRQKETFTSLERITVQFSFVVKFVLPSLQHDQSCTLKSRGLRVCESGAVFLFPLLNRRILNAFLPQSPPQLCPVCRSEVEHVQHVYLPTCTSLLNLTLTDNHQHRSNIPAPIHRDTASPHTCSTTEYEHKLYHT